MCTQKSPYNWSEQLYQRHGEVSALSLTLLNIIKNTIQTNIFCFCSYKLTISSYSIMISMYYYRQ